MDRRYKYSNEQAQFIRSHVKGLSNRDLADAFNKEFGTCIDVKKIISFKKNNKLTSGLDCRFFKGQVSHNKGKKGTGGWKPTQFKKGNRPINYMPVGSERVNTDGYVDVKIADPNKWRQKHLLIWEEQNGPVPEGHVVIFADANSLNVTIENLLLITRKQLVIMNKNGLIKSDPELTKTGTLIADLKSKIYQVKKEATK